MKPETENDNLPRRAESPSVEKVSAWLASLIILLGLFLYAKYRKEKSDAATCVMNIRNFQVAARSFIGLNLETTGVMDSVDAAKVNIWSGVTMPICPSGGSYTVHGRYCDPPGTLFLRCSHPDHQPDPAKTLNW